MKKNDLPRFVLEYDVCYDGYRMTDLQTPDLQVWFPRGTAKKEKIDAFLKVINGLAGAGDPDPRDPVQRLLENTCNALVELNGRYQGIVGGNGERDKKYKDLSEQVGQLEGTIRIVRNENQPLIESALKTIKKLTRENRKLSKNPSNKKGQKR